MRVWVRGVRSGAVVLADKRRWGLGLAQEQAQRERGPACYTATPAEHSRSEQGTEHTHTRRKPLSFSGSFSACLRDEPVARVGFLL